MIGIIGAMSGEVQGLKELLQDVTVTEKSGMQFYSGKLHGNEVIVVQSGVGKVNAGICAALLIHIFGADVLINTGIAGSLNNLIDIGDVVLSTDAVQHDVDATGFGKYPYGQIPGLDTFSFKADRKLLSIAEEACLEVNHSVKVFRGRVVSGDQFISDKAKKQWLATNFGAYCTEMEGAAIAQAAYLSKIPFIIVRVISDKADDSSKVDYPEFERKAIEYSVRLTNEIIKNIRK
ncbi:MAG: 5'-methylthioadenosine/adenosylhomocysteine nucleosidase [Ruminococcus sp.]|nr:5'-methylthioadenosine/adenosylhomocysteine nucleosidase [Ruminococcus sp.]